MKTLLTLFIATFFISQTAPEHRAWIATDRQSDLLTIQGKFANNSPQAATLRYELVTVKQGTSGSSRSTQAGEFTAPAGQEVSLSNTTINVTKEDTYVIDLKIYRDGTVYLEDSIRYQG